MTATTQAPLACFHIPKARTTDKRKRGDSSGCGGPYIYGPNWNVSALGFGVIPRVEDAVGGEIVGFHERDC